MKMFSISEKEYREFIAKTDKILASNLTADMFGERLPAAIPGQVAVIPVHGVISQYDSFMNWLCGGVSLDEIKCQIQECQVNPEVERIVLDMNTPGGTVAGLAEFCEWLYNNNGADGKSKPIETYVGARCFSAGMWMAAATSKITAHKTAMLGGIGVMAVCEKDDGSEIIITSENTPKKNQDPATDEGRAQIQAAVNRQSGFFMEALAEYRGVAVENVAQKFGAGECVFADIAIENDMIDAVGTYEAVIEVRKIPENALQMNAANRRPPTMKTKLMLVDMNAAGVVIPDGVDVETLDAEWLRTNMPDVVKEIEDSAENAEKGRQDEVDEVAADTEGDEEKAAVAKARKDRTMTAGKLSTEILAIRRKNKVAAEQAAAARKVQIEAEGGSLAGLGAQLQEPGEINQQEIKDFVSAAVAQKGRF